MFFHRVGVQIIYLFTELDISYSSSDIVPLNSAVSDQPESNIVISLGQINYYLNFS